MKTERLTMKTSYFLLAFISFISIQTIYSQKKGSGKGVSKPKISKEEKSIRSKLKKLDKTLRENKLTYAEKKTIVNLIEQLKKFSPEDAEDILFEFEYYNSGGCCDTQETLSEFERIDIGHQIDELLQKPKVNDLQWKNSIESLLKKLYNDELSPHTMCNSDNEEFVPNPKRRYHIFNEKYEQVKKKNR